MKNIVAQSVLGSDSFIDKIRRKYIMGINKTECPQANKLSSFMDLDILINQVTTYYKIDRDTIFAKFQKNNESRQMVFLLAKKYCRGRYSLKELADKLNISVHSFGANA